LDSEKSPSNAGFSAAPDAVSRHKLTEQSAKPTHRVVENPWNSFTEHSHPVEARRALYSWSRTQPPHIRGLARSICACLYMLERRPHDVALFKATKISVDRLVKITEHH
jgi:hypothetical protein